MVKKDYNQLYDDLIRGIPEDMSADDVLATHYPAGVTGGGGMGLGEFLDTFDTRPMVESADK